MVELLKGLGNALVSIGLPTNTTSAFIELLGVIYDKIAALFSGFDLSNLTGGLDLSAITGLFGK
ncbi:MAG: hypothetical protein LBJ11_05265 [Oscillospiraceae bacterium]|jgi:hypothetical protein|nr:hypothetical protein [Oscillospiraceae bacterium]